MPAVIESFEDATHPAEIGHVSVSDLSKMTRNMVQWRRHLSFAKQDIKRVVSYGKELIYLLDFSELHAYLWPSESVSQYKHLINVLFSNPQLRFVLPPGAVHELIRKLDRDSVVHRERRGAIEKSLDNPVIREFRKLRVADGAPLVGADLTKRILDEFRNLRTSDEGLERLARLYDQGKLTHLSAYIDVENIAFDKDVLIEAHSQLSASRLGKDENVNYVDALNYALAYGLNNQFYESSHYFFLLVTSSSRPFKIFEDIKWKEDPLYLEDPEAIGRVSLVRHPFHLLFHAHMLMPSKALRGSATAEIDQALVALDGIRKSWDQIPQFRAYLARKSMPGHTPVELPQTKEYRDAMASFTNFYQRVYRPLTEVLSLDTTTELNRRLVLGVSSSDAVGFIPTDEFIGAGSPKIEAPESPNDYRELLNLYDRVINLTVSIKTDQSDILKSLPSPIVGELSHNYIEPTKLGIRVAENSMYGCIETSAMQEVQNCEPVFYFGADSYPTFSSFFWETNVPFAEWAKMARMFIASATRWSAANGIGLDGEDKKLYDGLYLHLNGEIKHFPTNRSEDISSDFLSAIIKPNWKVRFLRLGLPFADLCYDFYALDGVPQRAGVLTHIYCPGAIADLIHWTNARYVPRTLVQKAVGQTLNRASTAMKAGG